MALTTFDRLLDDVAAVALPDEGAGLVIGGRCYPVQGMSIYMVRKMAKRIRSEVDMSIDVNAAGDAGNVPDAIEWELRASNGTVIKVEDVVFQQEGVHLPDCDEPYAPVRFEHGPVRISAVIAGTGRGRD